jgi:hypothetical protein
VWPFAPFFKGKIESEREKEGERCRRVRELNLAWQSERKCQRVIQVFPRRIQNSRRFNSKDVSPVATPGSGKKEACGFLSDLKVRPPKESAKGGGGCRE